jgi:hypothetical protein
MEQKTEGILAAPRLSKTRVVVSKSDDLKRLFPQEKAILSSLIKGTLTLATL